MLFDGSCHVGKHHVFSSSQKNAIKDHKGVSHYSIMSSFMFQKTSKRDIKRKPRGPLLMQFKDPMFALIISVVVKN